MWFNRQHKDNEKEKDKVDYDMFRLVPMLTSASMEVTQSEFTFQSDVTTSHLERAPEIKPRSQYQHPSDPHDSPESPSLFVKKSSHMVVYVTSALSTSHH